MKTKVLINVSIECDPPSYVGRYKRTLEDKAKELESWCREFEDFIRDHRSQDPVSLNVVREYQTQCSHCGYEWEIDSEGVPVCCNEAQKEHWEKTNAH